MGKRPRGYVALAEYAAVKQAEEPNFAITRCGLVVSETHPWLAVSPDGLVESPSNRLGIVEIKCPYSCRAGKSFFLFKKDEQLALRRSHRYYYQVQLQMAVTGRQWTDFVVWTPNQTMVLRILPDDSCVSNMYEKLKNFYFSRLLPALYAEVAQ